MSYVRFDDKHDDGQLSSFRERLENEVRIQTGEAFPIFQDRNNIAWGENWKPRIEESLDAVTILLVIVTPGLFKSTACREEVARFRGREKKLGRDDLILPVYYVTARAMDDPALRRGDDMAELLWSRQYADWRELRFEPMTSPVARRAVAHLATRMAEVFHPGLERSAGAPARAMTPSVAGSVADTARASVARTEPPTHVVDAYARGDFTTVNAAIKAARPGDRILVRPGLYEESLVVGKPLEIIGDGPVEDIEIRGEHNKSVLVFNANIGRVANLTLRQVADPQPYGVSIRQGRLDLEGCDISSRSGSCVYILGGSDPRLRRNKIHDGKHHGVYIGAGASGTLEDNEIYRTENAVVAITGGANPVLRRNFIRDGKKNGVLIEEDSLATLDDNEISGNMLTGVAIRTGANPTIRGNRIIRNVYQAVYILDGGKGVVEDNDLTGNGDGPWHIVPDCEPNVIRARNKEK